MKKEDLAKIYFTYRFYIFPAVIIISSLILITLVIYPQISKLISNNKVENDLKKRTDFLQTKAQALEGYNKEDLDRSLSSAFNSFPADKDFINVIGLIQNLVTKNGFALSSINLGGLGIKAVGGVESFGVKIEILGSKALLSSLVNDIEAGDRIMKVSSIDVTSGKDGSSVNASLAIDILYSPIPTDVGSIDSPLPQVSQKEQELIAKLAVSSPGSISATSPNETPSGPRGKDNPFE